MNIPLFRIYTDERDIEAVAKVIRRGSHWANGEEVELFEQKVADYVGTKYAVAFNSGTSALHAALLALGIGKGDEVIVPSFTFPATANMVVAVGAKPVFAEIEDETYGLDIADAARRSTGDNKAVIPVHYGGCACRDTRGLMVACQANKLHLIEDSAESLGASIDSPVGDTKVGTFGKVAMFSFCAPKVITTGEGGVLVTSNEFIRTSLLQLRDHGKVSSGETGVLGYNWRMSSMTAALGISQLEKIEEIIAKRRMNAWHLHDAIQEAGKSCSAMDARMIRLPLQPEGFRHIYQMYTIRVPQEDRDPLLKHLNDNGIGCKVYFLPVHLMPLYRNMGWKEGDLPITEQICKEVLTLPMYPDLTIEEMDYVVEKIRGYFSAQKY